MSLPFDWFILLLRVLFVFLLYFFLFQIARTIARELRMVSIATAGGQTAANSEPPRAVAQLVLEGDTEGGLPAGTTFTLRPGAVVGRRPGSDIFLNDTYMSGEHARLTLHEGRWWLADLGSTNGTFVNGTRIDRPTPLAPGAEIRFGRINLRFTI
ncbi:MAG TPA: FHA domain-containing protein [Thermomicrobiales bacterium]|jgi:pSer/pThr/pTyr-binding forkhead associated (FHA) protein